MSFSAEVKEELSKINNFKNKEVIEGEFLGYVLTSNSNISKNSVDSYIDFITENEFNIERFYKILFNLDLDYEPSNKGKCFLAKIKKTEKLNSIIFAELNANDEYQKAIVRGAFLGSGSILDPEKQYHLEITFLKKENAEYILNICKEYEVNFKLILSRKKYILYLKEGELISSFLALVGAQKSVLKFEDIRVTREMRNNVNRKVNCETSNLSKVVNASVDQINDIKFLQKINKFEELPDGVKEVAMLRLENPDVSIKVLGELLENPIGKSGVNHRLQKIHELAEEYKIGK